MKYSKCIALSIIASIVSSTVIANTASQPDQYPKYVSAEGVPLASQIAMEARWLHLNSTHIGGVTIPKSYDTSGYWPYMKDNNDAYKKYLSVSDNGSCFVPQSGNSNDATVERAMQQQGLDIYDGAVWQMALAVALKNNPDTYAQDIQEYKNFLVTGLTGGFTSYYAFNNYFYNGKLMPHAKNSYLLKFVSPNWALNYDALNDCNMNWPEWSAVTGEEAWAVFLGPVQSIYLLNDGAHNPDWAIDSESSDYLQLGKNALGAIQAMQAPTGGVLRNVTMPQQAPNFDVSLENNFSLYAGLTMFEQALKSRVQSNTHKLQAFMASKTKSKSDLKSINDLKQLLKSDQDDINTVNTIKTGMVKFFAGQGGVQVFDKDGQYFYASVNGTTPGTKDFAVDVQTWGATVIATSKKDPNDPNDPDLLGTIIATYGAGKNDVMYNMLQAAITKSGYYADDTKQNLLGVGYTAQTSSDDFYELSGEWTFGAINAAIVLADYYKDDSSKQATLISEAKQMLAGVAHEASTLQGSQSGITSRVAYLYANKRIFIPFGWFSNKMPSTASTGWSLMVNSCFNPMELGGGGDQYKNICSQLFPAVPAK